MHQKRLVILWLAMLGAGGLGQVAGLRYQPEAPPAARLALASRLLLPPSMPAKLPSAALRPAPMPRAYAYDQLGLFCKWEVQLEKSARLPVKVRLGEVQYVERLEGKAGGWQ